MPRRTTWKHCQSYKYKRYSQKNVQHSYDYEHNAIHVENEERAKTFDKLNLLISTPHDTSKNNSRFAKNAQIDRYYKTHTKQTPHEAKALQLKRGKSHKN